MSVIFEYTSPKYLSEDMKRVQALSMVCSGKKYEDSLVESVNHSMRRGYASDKFFNQIVKDPNKKFANLISKVGDLVPISGMLGK